MALLQKMEITPPPSPGQCLNVLSKELQDRAMIQTWKINNLPTTQHIQNVSCDKLRLFTPLVVLLIMYTSNIDLTCITLARQVNCSFLVT